MHPVLIFLAIEVLAAAFLLGWYGNNLVNSRIEKAIYARHAQRKSERNSTSVEEQREVA